MGLEVNIVTPENPITAGAVDEILAPSVLGEVGILPDHRSLLADLKEGLVVLRKSGGSDTYAVSGGFLEVSNNRVTVLAQSAEHSKDIDVARSRQALADAESQIAKLESSSPEYHTQMARARRARVRLEVANSATP